LANLRFSLLGLAAVVIAVTALNLGGFLEESEAAWFIDPNRDGGALLSQGRQVYAEHCAGCHGANLEGEPNWRERRPDGAMPAPPQDASGHTWQHTDDLLIEIISQGGKVYLPKGDVSRMPAFGEILTLGEITAVLAFIKSHWPTDVLDIQKAICKAAR